MTLIILGIDVGGVIIDRANDRTDTSFFGPSYLASKPVPGALESIELLSQMGMKIYLVSKCGPAIERKTREWLAHNGFHEKTGIPEDHVRTCRQRKDKAEICRRLGITHFVDDRLEVLSHLSTVNERYLFNPDAREVARFSGALPSVRRVGTWEELLGYLIADSGESSNRRLDQPRAGAHSASAQ